MNGSVTNRSERGLCCVVCFEQVCFEREPQFILQSMKRNGESTHPCRSAVPTASGCDSTPPTRIQTSEQECSDLPETDGCQHRPPGTLPKAFLWNLIVCFLEVDKTCVNIFGILCQTCLLEGEALVCCAAPRAKTVLGGILLQLWFNYFAASFSGTSHTLYQQG